MESASSTRFESAPPSVHRRHFASVRTVNGRGPPSVERVRGGRGNRRFPTIETRAFEAKLFSSSRWLRRCHSHGTDTHSARKVASTAAGDGNKLRDAGRVATREHAGIFRCSFIVTRRRPILDETFVGPPSPAGSGGKADYARRRDEGSLITLFFYLLLKATGV